MDIKLKIINCLCTYSLLVSCGSDTATSTPAPTPVDAVQSGYFLDSAVEGLRFLRSDGVSGNTASDGYFPYYYGDIIEFSVGAVVLGSAAMPQATDPVMDYVGYPQGYRVTPHTLSLDAAAPDDSAVVNKLILLQTLDDDGYPDNGIHITEAMHQALDNINLDFSLSTDEFIKGDFLTLVTFLNANQLFSANMPRTIPSEIEVLRHFGKLNFSPFESTESVLKSWWSEVNGCTGIGMSRVDIINNGFRFCPNINGLDGCYDGVVLSDGKILLPEMKTNTGCGVGEDGQYVGVCGGMEHNTIVADLYVAEGKVTGYFEASCNDESLNNIQTVAADFIKISGNDESVNYYLYSAIDTVIDEIDGDIDKGYCDADSDCNVLDLYIRYECSATVYKAYSTQGIDMEGLLLKRYIHNNLQQSISLDSVSGTVWCFGQIPLLTSRCVANACQFEDGSITSGPYQN